MNELTVHLGEESYRVHIGKTTYNLFSEEYKEFLHKADKVGIFADETAAMLHIEKLKEALLQAGISPTVYIIPAGEACKTPENYISCQSFLLNNNFTRKSILIAFGGGACGDVTGFVAATYMRGIPFIQCPTTILSHDSAVGGKTAINMPEGKNMVGAFHQPAGVLFQTDLFTTLPEQEIRSGMAELLKHALISDEQWAESLLSKDDFPLLQTDELERQLLKGIQVKASIVEKDTYENNTRKFLNFGHTLGHALEAYFGYGRVSHGECVMIGMAYSLLLSAAEGAPTDTLTDRFIRYSLQAKYPLEKIVDVPFHSIVEFMKKDKKAESGKLLFVLLHKLGVPFVQHVPLERCESVFEELKLRVAKEMRI